MLALRTSSTLALARGGPALASADAFIAFLRVAGSRRPFAGPAAREKGCKATWEGPAGRALQTLAGRQCACWVPLRPDSRGEEAGRHGPPSPAL